MGMMLVVFGVLVVGFVSGVRLHFSKEALKAKTVVDVIETWVGEDFGELEGDIFVDLDCGGDVLECNRLDEGYLGDTFDVELLGEFSAGIQAYGRIGMAHGVRRVLEEVVVNGFGANVESVMVKSSLPLLVSEEGQYWDFPDYFYYTNSTPYINTSILSEECDLLVEEYGKNAGILGFNGVVILVHDVEDFINYDNLQNTIWPPNSVHRIRSKALTGIVDQCLSRLTTFGLRTYFQPYEFAYPPQLCQQYNCTLGSTDLPKILTARYTELFQSIPSLDGIIATVTDSWQPRAGYEFLVQWSDMKSLGVFGKVLFDAVTATNGKSFALRLWTLGKAVDWDAFVEETPSTMGVTVKITEGDYVLDQPMNELLLNKTVLRERPFQVLVDAFREYNGWGAGLCFMQQWGDRLPLALENGVKGVNIWGAWSPGCTWPNSNENGELLNSTSTSAIKAWGGRWNEFRVMGNTVGNVPAVSGWINVRLAIELARDNSTTPMDVARKQCALWLGNTSAESCAMALMASQDVWAPFTQPQGDFSVTWTVLVNADVDAWKSVSKHSTKALDDIALPALTASNYVLSNLTNIETSNQYFEALYLSANRTSNLVQSFVCLKEAAFYAAAIQHSPTTPISPPTTACLTWAKSSTTPSTSPCTQLKNIQQATLPLFHHWQTTDPQLGTYWQVHTTDPNLDSRPSFWRDAQHGPEYPRSQAQWFTNFTNTLSLC